MRKISLMAGCALAAIAAPVAAQEAEPNAEPAAASPAAPGFDEIVVTARRREESAQTVPVSIAAIGQTALAERTVRSLGDLTSLAPGIRFVQQGGGSNMNVVMRGLSRVPIGDAPNAVISYFADIPMVFAGSNVPTYDLGSIQVYKGPQGTLFGRNAIAGAVVITPQAPTYESEGYFRIGGGNYSFKEVEGVFNVPLVDDKVALRLAGRVQRRNGTTKNLGIGPDFDDIHTDSFRVSLLLEPIDNLRNITVFDYLHADEAGSVGILSKVLPTGLVRTRALAGAWDCHSAVGAANCGSTFSPDRDIDDALIRQREIGPHKVYSGENSTLLREIYGLSNRTELSLGDITLRNIFGYRHTDVKSTDFETDGVNFTPTVFTGSLWTQHRQISDEVSVLGKALDNRLDFIIGGIYIKEDPFAAQGGRFQAASRLVPWVEAYNTKKNKAVYGQVGFKILPSVKLNAGYRYNKDTSDACTVVLPISATGGVPPASPPVGPDACPTQTGRSLIGFKGTSSTYTLGVDWQITNRVFAYVASRKGYREGGVNYPGFTTPCTTGANALANNCLNQDASNPAKLAPDLRPYQTYDPEKLVDYEIGIKTDWTIGSVAGRFNVSAYTGKYSDVQTAFNTSAVIRSSDQSAPQSSSLAINTGSRRLSGVEAELTVRPFRGFSITNGTAYTKQKVLSAPAVPFAGAQAPALDGVSPKWSTSTAVRWATPLGAGDAELVVNADYYYQTSYFVANAKLPAYDVTNLRVDVNHVFDSAIDLGFFMRNVFNQDNAVAGGATTNTLGVYTFSYAEPRIYGLEAKFSF